MVDIENSLSTQRVAVLPFAIDALDGLQESNVAFISERRQCLQSVFYVQFLKQAVTSFCVENCNVEPLRKFS